MSGAKSVVTLRFHDASSCLISLLSILKNVDEKKSIRSPISSIRLFYWVEDVKGTNKKGVIADSSSDLIGNTSS